MRRGLTTAMAIAAMVPAIPRPTMAAGYAVKEFSAEAMAMAYAGAAATNSNAGYLPYNPAAAAGVSDFDITASAVGILPGSSANYRTSLTTAGTATGGDTAPRNFIGDALVPSFALRLRISPKLSAGLSLYAPWGLSTSYPETWAGRYYARSTKLVTVNVTPVLAYQLLPSLVVAGGGQAEYAKGRLTSQIDTGTLGALFKMQGATPGADDSYAELNGTGWATGYVLGAMWRPDDALSLGVSYRSMLSHKLKGELQFRTDAAGIGAALEAATGLFQNTRQTTPVEMPPVLSFGATYALSDAWTLAGEIDWMGWSKFRQLTVSSANPAQPDDITLTRWKDSLFGSLGARYTLSNEWSFSGGLAYDQSPAREATREPRIPDADRIWVSLGADYRLGAHTDVDFTLSHLFNRTADISLASSATGNALRGTLAGTTRSYVNVLGLELNWRD